MKIDYTFHSHTFRCGHAEGDIEDYVLLALKNNLKIFGVSDHVFLPGVSQPHTRGDYSYLEDYISAFKESKKRHQNEIEMYLGFECEYADIFKNYYKDLLINKGFDFLILGQHCSFDNDKRHSFYFGKPKEIEEQYLRQYVKDLIDGMKSGLFLYVAHPDLLFAESKEMSPLLDELSNEIIEAGEKYNIPFEINIHGFLRRKHPNRLDKIGYPTDYFWSKIAKSKIRVVYGGDYHEFFEVGNIECEQQLNELIQKHNLVLSDIKPIYEEYRQRIDKMIKGAK